MKNHIVLGLMALCALAYSSMFLLLPETAMRLGNEPWGSVLNIMGFFCFIGGWGIFLNLLRHEGKTFVIYAFNALVFQLLAFLVSPAAGIFVQTESSRYMMFCAGFVGPIAGSLYVLSLLFRLHRTTANKEVAG